MASEQSPSPPAASLTTPPPEKKSPSAEDVIDDAEAAEVVIFQVKECFVYKIPPRKSAASHRADDWNINKWAWEGAMRVVSKGDQCVIRLEDTKTGELFAQAPIWADQPVPVEAVIDSSRFFVLRIEDTSATTPAPAPGPKGSAKGAAPPPGLAAAGAPGAPGPSSRHAFIGIGFRERPTAYDFQAAVYDHVKYLNKKKEAEEMEQEFQSRPAADYSLKAGQTLKLDIKRPTNVKGYMSKLRLVDKLKSPSTPGTLLFPPPAGSPIPPPTGSPPLAPPGGLPLPTVPKPPGPGMLSPAMGPTVAPPIRQTSGEQDGGLDDLKLEGGKGEGEGEKGVERKEGEGHSEAKHENGGSEKGQGAASADEEEDFGDFQAA